MNKRRNELISQIYQIRDAIFQIEKARQLLEEECKRLRIELDEFDDEMEEIKFEKARELLLRGVL